VNEDEDSILKKDLFICQQDILTDSETPYPESQLNYVIKYLHF